MIRQVNLDMDEYRGKSTDTKPSGIANGTTFLEIDTGAKYMYDEENGEWCLMPSSSGGGGGGGDNTEVISARTGADGTRYGSLKGRLDAENEDLNDKIDGEISLVKSHLDDYVIDRFESPVNWFDPDAISNGKIKTDGTVEANEYNIYTGFIPVKAGDAVRAYGTGSGGLVAIYKNTICAYDGMKTAVPSAGNASVTLSEYTVPNGIAYIRISLSKTYQTNAMITINTVPTAYEQYFSPSSRIAEDFLTEETAAEIANQKTKVENLTETVEENLTFAPVKGTNLVTDENTGVGYYYYSGGIKYDASTSYKYAIVNIKPNTRYFVNLSCRFWILTDENDIMVSYGNASLGKFFFDSGNAKKMYYSVSASTFNAAGLIIAEGYSGSPTSMSKPEFLQGLNQLTDDSWFAVALTPLYLRFTQGISEKLYYFNILSLEKNIIALGALGTPEDDGYIVHAYAPTEYNNGYGYTVYDDNLSVVASLPRAGSNRLYVYADNVSDCSALLIGDSIIARTSTAAGGAVIGKTLLDAFTERNKTITLLGTLGSGLNKNEGRPGWTAARYFTNDTYEGVVNPFYNPTSQTFDFGYYMTNQGYNSVDFVVIHLGGNDLFSTPLSEARAKIKATEDSICAMIDSILAWNPNQKIIIQLAPTTSTNSAYISKVEQKLVRAKFTTYNAEMLVILTKYPTVRCSNDYMIVNPATELADHIHPTSEGLAKIGMELLSQINCWQNQT